MDKLINWYKPSQNDLDNVGNYIVYGLKWLLVLIVLFVVVYIIKNRKRIFGFLTSTIEELRKVDWLDRKTLRQYTAITIIFMTLLTLVVMGFDNLFVSVRSLII